MIFNTDSSAIGKGKLRVLGTNGAPRHQIPLSDRVAMPARTLADVDADGNGSLEIVVGPKGQVDPVRQPLGVTAPASAENWLPWPSGRGSYHLQDGFSALPPAPAHFADGFASGNRSAWSATQP